MPIFILSQWNIFLINRTKSVAMSRVRKLINWCIQARKEKRGKRRIQR